MARRRSHAERNEARRGLDVHIGFWLRLVSNQVSGRFRAEMESRGFTVSEWVALSALSDTGVSSAQTLTRSLGMTKGAVSKILGKLEEKKLVRRVEVPEDGRAWRLELTHAGRALVPKLAKVADENDAYFFDCLTPDARASLVHLLETVAEARSLARVPTD